MTGGRGRKGGIHCLHITATEFLGPNRFTSLDRLRTLGSWFGRRAYTHVYTLYTYTHTHIYGRCRQGWLQPGAFPL